MKWGTFMWVYNIKYIYKYISWRADLTIFNISKSVHEGKPYETLRGRICHQHIQKRVQHDLLLETNTHMHVLNRSCQWLEEGGRRRVWISSSYLLREARPHRVLRVAERRTLEHGCGELQHLPEKLIELGKHHDSTRVRDLWENIWERANVRLIILSKEQKANRLLTFLWMYVIDPQSLYSAERSNMLNEFCMHVPTLPLCV